MTFRNVVQIYFGQKVKEKKIVMSVECIQLCRLERIFLLVLYFIFLCW